MNQASQIQPPLKEIELVTEFLQSLPDTYYRYLIGHTTQTFNEIVLAAQCIEEVFCLRKLTEALEQKKPFQP